MKPLMGGVTSGHERLIKQNLLFSFLGVFIAFKAFSYSEHILQIIFLHTLLLVMKDSLKPNLLFSFLGVFLAFEEFSYSERILQNMF